MKKRKLKPQVKNLIAYVGLIVMTLLLVIVSVKVLTMSLQKEEQYEDKYYKELIEMQQKKTEMSSTQISQN